MSIAHPMTAGLSADLRASSLTDDETRSFATLPRGNPGGQAPPPSISSQLRRTLLLRLGIVFLLCAIAFFLFLRVSLVGYYDATTMGKLRALESSVAVSGNTPGEPGATATVNFEELRRAMPEFERGREPEYFQFWQIPAAIDSGASNNRLDPQTLKVLSRSPTLDRPDGPGEPGLRGKRGLDMPIRLPVAGSGTVTADITLPDGRPGRCTWAIFTPATATTPLGDGIDHDHPAASASAGNGGPRLLLAVARARTRLDHSLRTVALGLLGMGLIGGIVVRFSVRNTIEHAMGPVNRLAAAMAALDERRLPSKLDVPPLPLEIEPVRERLDELLSRINAKAGSQSEAPPPPAGPSA